MYNFTDSERSLIKSATHPHQLGDILTGALQRTRDPRPALELWLKYTLQSPEANQHPWFSEMTRTVEEYLHQSRDLSHLDHRKMRCAQQSTFALVLPYEIQLLQADMRFLYTGYQIDLEVGKADLLC